MLLTCIVYNIFVRYQVGLNKILSPSTKTFAKGITLMNTPDWYTEALKGQVYHELFPWSKAEYFL